MDRQNRADGTDKHVFVSSTTTASSPISEYSDPFADPKVEHPVVEGEESKENVTTNSNIFQFVKIRVDFLHILMGIVCMSISALGSPIQTIIYGKVFDKLAKFLKGDYATPGKFIDDVRLLCGLIMVTGGARMVFTWLGLIFWMQFGEKQQARARSKAFRALFTKNAEWFDTKENLMGELSQINRCFEELRSGNAEVIGLLVQTSTSIVFLFLTSMIHSWSLTLVITSLSPLMALSGWGFGRLTYRAADKENHLTAKCAKILDWNFTSGNFVRAFNGKLLEIIALNKAVNASAKAYYQMSKALSANIAFLKAFSLLAVVPGFWFGVHMVSAGRLKISQVFTTFSSCVLLASSISGLAELLATLNSASAAATNISKYTGNMTPKPERGFKPTNIRGDIRFEDVSFKYPNREEWALDGIDLDIKQGSFTYIVGHSGSGKSTLSQLLMRFYGSAKGDIYIDDTNINLLDEDWIFDNITLIQSSSVVFDTSLRENIAMAVAHKFLSLNDVPDMLIEDACQFSLLSDLIYELPQGWESKVGSSKLSGGQQQKLSLARAKIRDTPILILDEALSAIDIKSREQIMRELRSWRKGKTTLMITHDFNHIDDHDNVIIMENHRVKQAGIYMNMKSNDRFLAEQEYNQKQNNKESTTAATFDEPTSASTECSAYNYLTDPVILKGLESEESYIEERPETLMSVLSILNYCRKTIDAKLLVCFGVSVSVLSAVASPVFSFCLSKLLLNLVNTSVGADKVKITREMITWSATIIGLAFFDGVASFAASYSLHYAGERWIVNMRKLVFNKICDQNMSFFHTETTKPGELTALLMNDTRDLRNLVSEFLKLWTVLTVMLLVGVIWSIVSGWKLSLVGIAFVPLILLVTGAYNAILEVYENKYKTSIAQLENIGHETASGLKTIFALKLKSVFLDNFLNELAEVRKVGLQRAIATGFGIALEELCTSVATGTIMYYGLILVAKSEYTQSQLLQVSTILTMTLGSAGGLLSDLPEIARGQRSGTYMIGLMGLKPSPSETQGSMKPFKMSKDILRFKDLSFTHSKNSLPVLSNISFSIKKGEITAIVGQSGSGKSTLVSLILRLYEVQSNQILLSDCDINSIDVERLRELVAIVPQSPKFFEGSIYDNLVYGLDPRKVSIDKINASLQRSNSLEFVNLLPQGIYTTIGTGLTSSLSTGQLQRLSIARALMRESKVLLLDECTSNLDPENTLIIHNLVQDLSDLTDLTIVIITHEINMMQLASKLVVLNEGKLAEIGEFNQLYNRKGELYNLVNSACS